MTRLNKQQERRLHPRIDSALPMRIVANGYDFSTSSQNVSCVGAYCTIQKYIPPFTKLAVKMAIPNRLEAAPQMVNVECKGVVVRSEDNSSGAFNVAIFFNEIKDGERQKISNYISRQLSK